MMAVTLLLIILLGWICLPFLPGIIEIWKKTDASPLKVIQEYDVDVHYFANVFRNYVEQHFPGLPGKTQDVHQGEPRGMQKREGQLEDGTQYYVLSQQDAIPLQLSEKDSQVTHTMLVSLDSMKLPGAMSYLTELYASDSIHGGKEDIYRALLAEKDIEIEENSMLLRWMHAGKSINVKPGSVLHGRVSADQSIHLTGNCRYERLYAPTIRFGSHMPRHKQEHELKELAPEDIGPRVEVAGGRWLIEDDVEIPDNSLVNSNLVVVGQLKIGRSCHINGSVKSRHELDVGQDTVITGSLVSNNSIHCGEHCEIAGPVISEKTIYLDSHSIIGTTEKPTTVSAEEIHIKTNTVAHGSVWARQKGTIEEAEGGQETL